MTIDEIMQEARSQNIESLGDVKWGVLESTGKMTFIEKH